MVKRKRKQRPASSRQQPRRAPGRPSLLTAEGDPLVFSTALYRHTDIDAVLQILAGADDFELQDAPEPEPDGVLRIGWYEVSPAKQPPLGPLGRRILAGLTLKPETLEIETMSERRLARCRQRVERLLGDRVHLLRTEAKSMEQLRAEGPPEDIPEPPVLPPEVIANLEEQMLLQWIDSSIPALGGMTPRQAVRTPEGRQMVLDLLDYIERQQARHPPAQGVFRPDYRKAKKMLGME